MNILFIEYDSQHFHQQVKLVDGGHNVWSTWSNKEYHTKFGIQSCDSGDWTTWTESSYQSLTNKITSLNIDTVILGIPWLHWLRGVMPEGVTFLAATEDAFKLETDKFATRTAVSNLGLNVLDVVGQGKTDAFDLSGYSVRPVIVKPKNSFAGTHVIYENQDAAAIAHFEGFTESQHYDYYLEKFLPNMKLEAEVHFIIANDKWAIYYTGEMQNETDRRTFIKNKATSAWISDVVLKKLSSDINTKVLAAAKTFLDWAVTKGGNYCGSINFGVDNSDELYWIECNARADAYNCLPCNVSGSDYLAALTTDPDKYVTDISQWTFTTVASTINNSPIQEYPFNLHAEYEVDPPNCLLKQEDKYRTNHGGIVIYSQGDLPTEFVTKLTADEEYKIVS